MSRLTRDETAEPVSRDQILRHAPGQGNIHFPCLADHEQDWQPYPVDPYSAICDDHTYIHTCYTRLPTGFVVSNNTIINTMIINSTTIRKQKTTYLHRHKSSTPPTNRLLGVLYCIVDRTCKNELGPLKDGKDKGLFHTTSASRKHQ